MLGVAALCSRAFGAGSPKRSFVQHSTLHDASYLANAVIVSLKWLSHDAEGEGLGCGPLKAL